jgi:hypothetical protein
MADPSSPLQFEDVPLEEARRMGHGPRMGSLLYDTLRHKIQALAETRSASTSAPRLGRSESPWRRAVLALPRGGPAAGSGDGQPAAGGAAITDELPPRPPAAGNPLGRKTNRPPWYIPSYIPLPATTHTPQRLSCGVSLSFGSFPASPA